MVDPQERVSVLETADSFVSLARNPAFKAIMEYLASQVEVSKAIAINAPADMPTENVRRCIIAWQEREKVVIGIESVIEEQLDIKTSIEQEMENERAVERDRASRKQG